MFVCWWGPAPARRTPARSHPFAYWALAVWATSLCAACNIGHDSPKLDDAHDTTNGADANGADANGESTGTSGTETPDAGEIASGSTPVSCTQDAYRCVMSGKPERERCDEGTWVPAEACGRGLVCELANASTTTCVSAPTPCDGGACDDNCQVGSISCRYVEGAPDVALSCPDGTATPNTCNGETPHCVNQEGCKACSRAAHCTAEPPPCHVYTCSQEFVCELVPQPEGQKCASGVCNDRAECVPCNTAQDCGQPEICHHFSCDDHVCVATLATERSACHSDAGSLCAADGTCVECLTSDDCTSIDVTECHRAACEEGTCSLLPSPELSACAADKPGVCDGAGTCALCLTAEQCSDGYVCHERICESSTVHLGLYDDTVDGSEFVHPDLLYAQRLEPLKYPAVLQGFGQIAHADTGEAIRFALYEDNGRGTGPQGPALATTIIEGLPEGYHANPSADDLELQAGVYFWLLFRVTNEVELRLGSASQLALGTGARFEATTAFDEPFYEADGEDLAGLDNTPWAVFAVVQSTH